jgi:predicted AAA+ superfamily ATPase
MFTETSEEFCPNCSLILYPFMSTSSFHKGTYNYCRNVNCHFASFYDDAYQVARKYYINHKVNVYGFEFYDPNVETDSNVKTIRKYYKLDLSNIVGHQPVKQTLIDTINATKPLNLLLSGSPSTSKTFMIKTIQKQIEEQNPNSTLFLDCATSTFSGGVTFLLRN